MTRLLAHGTPPSAGAGKTLAYDALYLNLMSVRCLPRRLHLPRLALLRPGALTLHLLPPQPTAATAASGPNPAPFGPSSHAPLCFLPLLVLPAAAAREVAQLHAYAVAREMRWGEQGQRQDGAGGGGESSDCTVRAAHGLLGGGNAAAAMSALHSHDMYGMAYDFGALLDLPYTIADSTAADGSGPSPDPWVFCGVLRLLAEQGMGACLRMGLGAMQRAGVRLQAGDGGAAGDEQTVDARASAGRGGDALEPSGSHDPDAAAADDAGAEVDAAVAFVLQAMAGQPQGKNPDRGAARGSTTEGAPWRQEGPAQEHEHGAQRSSSVSSADADVECLQPSPNPGALPPPNGVGGAAAPGIVTDPSSCHRPSSPSPSPPPFLPPPLPPCSNWRWWLRSLFVGFSPAPLESAYQRYKAARSRACDIVALLSHVAMASITLVRMVQDTGGAGGTLGGGGGGGSCVAEMCWPRAEAWGGVDPQLAGQVLWLRVSLAALLLRTR